MKFTITKKELVAIIEKQEKLHKKVIRHVQRQIEPKLKRFLPNDKGTKMLSER